MNTPAPPPMDVATDRLEEVVSRLLERYLALQEENRLLHEQLQQIRAETAATRERNEQARHHVEGMIARLRAMESTE